MGSSLGVFHRKVNELSAEGVGNTASSPNSLNSYTGSKKSTSLDILNKKVQQLEASRCRNARMLYFACKQGHVIERYIRCNRRFVIECLCCALKWRRRTVERYSKIVSEMQNPKLVTLTLRKHGRHKLADLIELVQRFRFYLSRSGYKIRGFVFCLEPPNHVHCIWDCGYIPQRRMSVIWENITKDSFIVDIRVVDKHRWRKAVSYIAKYITKISETGSGMRGLHVIGSWGGAGGKKVRMICKECGSYFHPLWDLDYVVEKYVSFEYVTLDDYG